MAISNRVGCSDLGLASTTETIVDGIVERIASEVESRIAALLPEPPPALLDRRGLAQFLGVSLPTVDKLRGEGCPTLWVVDSPRFEREAVLEWLRSRGAS